MFALFRRAAPEPSEIAVEHEGSSFRIAVQRRPGLCRMTLRVSGATGEVRLNCPERIPFATIAAFARAHAGWVAARVGRVPDRVAFEPGATIPLRGVPHRILHRSKLRGRTQATLDAAGAPVIAVCGEPPHIARRITEFLQAEARRDLAAAVARHARSLDRPPSRIAIRDTRSRWGSCSSGGRLNFSWRLILAPPHVLDYLAAHEVAHLREMNHSARFWRLVRELCPGTDEAEAWLKRHGNDLHRFGRTASA